ncbi:MAG: hypothetical protein IPK82_28530 [Polyangiaceae bacterium]|nr:hypothetical protein [Polyangiaceae bacterium]
MRTHNPYPGGHAPQNADILRVFAETTKARLFSPKGLFLTELTALTHRRLGAYLPIVEGEPSFDLPYEKPLTLNLENSGGRVATLHLARCGAVFYQSSPTNLWSGYANLQNPLALFHLLIEFGAGEVVAPWVHFLGDVAALARSAWRKNLPAAVLPIWDPAVETSAVPDAYLQALLAAIASGSPTIEEQIGTLLEWSGSSGLPIAERGPHEDIVRALLARFAFDSVVNTIARFNSTGPWTGAALYLLHAAPYPPILRQAVDRLSDATKSSLLNGAASLGNSAVEDLRAALFPAPVEAPASTHEVGRSNTVALRRPVCTDTAVFALDGTEVVRLENGSRAPISMLLRESPAAIVDNALVWKTGAILQRRTLAGDVLPQAAAPTPSDVETARKITASWSAAPSPDVTLTAISPSAEEREAFETFHHIGMAPPISARLQNKVFADKTGGLVRYAEGAAGDRIVLGGTVLRTAVSVHALHAAVAINGKVTLAHVPDNGKVTFTPLDVEASKLTFWIVSPQGVVFFGVDTGAGIVVFRVKDVTEAPRDDLYRRGI